MKRCAHFLPMGLCTVNNCPHWDGFKSDDEAVSATRRDKLVRAKLRAVEQLEPGMARCVRCKKVKSKKDDFYADRSSKRGHHRNCKECTRRLESAAGGDLLDVVARSA